MSNAQEIFDTTVNHLRKQGEKVINSEGFCRYRTKKDGGMKQSRLMSLVEAVANVIVGYGIAVVTQILIFPVFGLHTTLAQNLKMGAVFTVVSLARSFALRRLFEAIRVRSGG